MKESICKEEIAREAPPLLGNIAMKLAHEVRNPLTTVRGYLQYFLEAEGSERDKAEIVLNILLPELDRVDKFIHDFLLFSRPFTPRKQYTYMNHLIHEFCRHTVTQQLALRDTNVTLDLSPDANKLPLHVDTEQIMRVMFSLFSNAMESSDNKTISITIQTKTSSETVSVCFIDDGRGMDGYALSQAFDPFFSAKKVGMGLGLPVSQKIIAMHGGTMNIRSRKGQGTSVMFTLPHG